MTKNTFRSVHYYSGLFLALFILMHIGNHLLVLISAENHIGFMEKARLIYRNPVVETLLLLGVLAQILTGLKLVKALKTDKTRIISEKLHIYSGLYLAFFLMIHVSAVMGGRYIFNLNTNIYFGAAGLNLFPFNLFFVPYYFLAVASIFTHIACIHYKKAQVFMGIERARNQAIFIGIMGIVLAFLIILGMMGCFKGLPIPNEYLNIYKF
jgi:hypothetical protein